MVQETGLCACFRGTRHTAYNQREAGYSEERSRRSKNFVSIFERDANIRGRSFGTKGGSRYAVIADLALVLGRM